MFKRALLASAIAACACVASSAQAAEWSGFYIGIHAGGAWGDIDTTNVTDGYLFWPLSPGDSIGSSPDGVLGGGQLGYNFEFNNWLFGVEVSGAGLDFDDTVLIPSLWDDDIYTAEVEWIATATGRLGWTWNQSLLYVKGGYAAGGVQTSERDFSGARGAFDTDETHNGWIAGAGWEHMISPDVSVGVEYNYIDLGEQDHSATPFDPITLAVGATPLVNNVDVQVQTVTARLNWHWNPY